MPINFQSRSGAAIDQQSGVKITMPRMLPVSTQDGEEYTEYQYSIYHGDKRISGLGLNGTDRIVDTHGRRLWISKLDLGRDWVLDSIFDIKHELGNDDSDFYFLQAIASGLLKVFEKEPNQNYDFHYVASSEESSLARRGIEVPSGIARLSSDEILLAENFVVARHDGVGAL